jgi:small subunit ribosomal protein S1
MDEKLNHHEVAEEDFASMLEKSFQDSDKERITTGTVIRVSDDSVLVDVGEKVEGRLNLSEVTDEDGNVHIKAGDTLPVLIMGYRNERPTISHQRAIRKDKLRQFIEELGSDYENTILEAKVIRKNRGGYILESNHIDLFMPKYMSALKDDSNHIGKSIKVCIVNIKAEEDSIIVSRKRYFEIDNERKKRIIDLLLKKEEPSKGVIKKITSFGMFVSVDDVEGLVHYTEISYKGPVNPAKFYQEGEAVYVKAIGYDEEKKRLSLSIKATMPDPWTEIQDELEVGDAIKVNVSNIEPYGVFVDLGNDIEGFLHISEISWNKNIKHPSEYLEEGQELNVEVIEIDTDKRKLRVSLKKFQPKPFETFFKTYKEGDVVTGCVTTLTDFGAFVKIDQVEGLLHNEDAFWEKSEKCKDLFESGQEIEVKIVKIDRERERISLSRKDVIESPAEAFAKQNSVDDIVKGVVRDIKDFGVFVTLSDSVDALIRNEDLYPMKKEEIEEGKEIEGVISMIDQKNNKIRVSIKRLEKKKERDNIKEFNSDDTSMTLGDRLKNRL